MTASSTTESSAWSRPRDEAVATTFVGRAATLDALHSSLLGEDRLVTLVGPPGIGKTRLASQYAQAFAASYPGGAWFCDLTAARDIVQANAVICATVGVRTGDRFGRAVSETLGDVLAGRGRSLLVLDNFEQLVDEGRWVGRWCAQAPELRAVVTSRERLRLPGELVIELGPLSLPRASATPAEVRESESARLFFDRARTVGAGGLDETLVGPLVTALDGIPLAIELAAARAHTLSPADMLARLSRRFDVLRTRGAHRDDRHATLEGAIDWSWDLLSRHEQTALAQCSVFAGGFALEAAESVVALGPLGPPVLEVLEALCDKSLVRAGPMGKTRRFSMYVSIHDYAAARLEELGGVGALARHASYFLAAAEAWSSAVTFRADASSRALLLSEHENVMAVYDRATHAHRAGETGRAEEALRAALALYPVLENHGPRDELLSMVDEAVQLSTVAGVPASLRARALFARGNAYGDRGKLRDSISDLEAALGVAEAAGDVVVLGEALVWVSVRYRHAGRFAEALAACDRAEKLLGETSHRRSVGLTLAVRGRMRGELGFVAESRADNEGARAIFREIGDRWFEGLTLANLGQLGMQTGNLDQARWYYEQSLTAFREVGDPRFEGRYLGYLGCLDWEASDRATARTRLEAAVEILERSRTLNYAPLFRGVLGGLYAELGEVEAALVEIDRAESTLASAGVPAYVAAVDVHRGQIDLCRARAAEANGQSEVASRLHAAAAARLRVKRPAGGASGPSEPTETALLDASDDVRFAVRMLKRAMAFMPDALATAPLVVGPEARWFSVGGRRVDLTRRGPIRLILEALYAQRRDQPGVALRQDSLLRAGWPGERVQADAASKRVRVAVSTLRRLGLEAVLVTRDDGYLLDPARPLGSPI